MLRSLHSARTVRYVYEVRSALNGNYLAERIQVCGNKVPGPPGC
jgi:hypothetical protein